MGKVDQSGKTRIAAAAALILAAISATCPCYGAAAEELLDGPVPARVLRVIDGDTIVVRARIWLNQDIETHVRVAGLDTPELHGKCERERDLADQARRFLQDKLSADSNVRLRAIASDKYGGRVLAHVETEDGQDVTQALVGAGLGRSYDGKRRATWCS